MLPVSDEIATVLPPMPWFAESRKLAENCTSSPCTTLSGPCRVNVVPTTLMVTVSDRLPVCAVTAIGRLVGSPPVPSSARAVPPPASSVSGSVRSRPESALNVTGTFSTTLLLASRTSALSVTTEPPSDGSWLLLAISEMLATGTVGPPSGGVGETMVSSLPHPASTRAARSPVRPRARRAVLLLRILGFTRVNSWKINRCCCLRGGFSASRRSAAHACSMSCWSA